MVEGLKARWQQRQLRQEATRLVTDRQGFAGKPWPLTVATAAAERAALASDIRAWRGRQLSATAAPYGIQHSLVGIWYVTQTADQRTPTGQRILG